MVLNSKFTIASLRGEVGIYSITCTKNNKVYIGSSTNIGHRWTCHYSELSNNFHKNSHLQNAWNLYGSDNFVFEVLQPVLNAENLASIEEHWIDLLNTTDSEIGYNKTKKAGGYSFLGKKHTAETKEKIAIKKRGIKQSPELIEKRASTLRGRKRDPQFSVNLWEIRRKNGTDKRLDNIERFGQKVAAVDDNGKIVLEFESIQDARRNNYYCEGALKESHRRCKGYHWIKVSEKE